MRQDDPEAAEMLETKSAPPNPPDSPCFRATQLFLQGRRCRDIFRRNTELGTYLNTKRRTQTLAEDEAVQAAIRVADSPRGLSSPVVAQQSMADFAKAEERRRGLMVQLERYCDQLSPHESTAVVTLTNPWPE